MAPKKEIDMSNFDWVELKTEIDAPHRGTSEGESQKEKLVRKIKENPVVPLGCLLTAGALSYGLASFRKGDAVTSQKMMRLRVAAQGLTVVALIVGIGMTAMKEHKPQ